MKTKQLNHWKNQFGEEYINRNQINEVNVSNAKTVFKRTIGDLKIDSILEIGSNIGINLIGIRKVFGDKLKIYAVEPNEFAFKDLSNNPEIKLEKGFNCTAFKIPLPDNSVDLVFTNGVLIHIAPEDLKKAMSEIVRVSKKYVFCSEYFSHTPTSIKYHGKEDLLFKRDFGRYYLENFPELKTVSYGFLWQQEFQYFDDFNWWLFEKK